MGLESIAEQGVKTAFRVFTDTLGPDDNPVYRCFLLDDETESGDKKEEREYPLVQITASPNWPTFHQSIFREIPVEIKWATHASADPKRAKLLALYDGCRAILDAGLTSITVTGYSVTGVIIEQGGESGVEDNEQYMTLPVTIKVCGA